MQTLEWQERNAQNERNEHFLHTQCPVSVISTGTQLASILAYTASLLSVKLHSGSLVNYANVTAAATGGVPVGNLYHTAGAVKVRLT
jgi:hypothetical protein